MRLILNNQSCKVYRLIQSHGGVLVWWCGRITRHSLAPGQLMGIIADRLRSRLERLKEIDRRHQESIDDLLQDTRKFLAECDQLTNYEE